MNYEQSANSMSVHENSIFHTNQPRDTKTAVHLVLVLLCFLSALSVAIMYAENGFSNFPLAAQRTMLNETEEQLIVYGKSE